MSQQNSQRNSGQQGEGPKWSWWYLLFLVQLLAVVWPPFYNKIEPTWAGIPFFYWYQTVWTFLGTFCTIPVYLYEEKKRK